MSRTPILLTCACDCTSVVCHMYIRRVRSKTFLTTNKITKKNDFD